MNKYKILDRFHTPAHDEQWVYSNNPCFGLTPEEQLKEFIGWVRQHGGYYSEIILDGDTEYEKTVIDFLDERRKNFKSKGVNGITRCRGAIGQERIAHYAEVQGE